jgi:hypothetical protein
MLKAYSKQASHQDFYLSKNFKKKNRKTKKALFYNALIFPL